jgi:Ca2+/H+ antiporter, TMEM165/GDT1 family
VGTAAALAVLVALVAVFGKALEQIPLPMLQIFVGALLLIFGTFWFGEGAGIAWPGQEASLVGLGLGFFGVALATIRLCRARHLKAFGTAAPEAGR